MKIAGTAGLFALSLLFAPNAQSAELLMLEQPG